MAWDDTMLSCYPCLKKKTCQRDTSLKGLCKHCQHYPQLIMASVKKWNFGDDTDGLLFTEAR